jgi:hypothetical protein
VFGKFFADSLSTVMHDLSNGLDSSVEGAQWNRDVERCGNQKRHSYESGIKGMKTMVVLWVSIAFFAFFVMIATPVDACTGFAAAGNKVVGGGALLAKNRDESPQNDSVCSVVPGGGLFRYMALKDENGAVKAGTNEYGLSVVSLSAPTVGSGKGPVISPDKVRVNLLSKFKTLKDVLVNKDSLFTNVAPDFLLISDRKMVACVEIAPNSTFSIETKTGQEDPTTGEEDDGVIYHTNHYLNPPFLHFNLIPGPGGQLSWADNSSLTRYARIRCLMQFCNQGPFTLQDFIDFSLDRTCGPDDSIWRIDDDYNDPANRHCTLATWIAQTPATGPPTIFVRIANPKADLTCANPEDWKCKKILLDDAAFSVPGKVDLKKCQLTAPPLCHSCGGAN